MTRWVRGPAFAAAGWMVLACALFSGMSLFGRLASHSAPWQVVGFVRAFVGVIVSLALVRARGAPIIVTGSRALWTRSLFGALGMALTFLVLASDRIALGDAATLFSLSPLILALVGPALLGERSGGRLMIAVPLGLAGIVLVTKPPLLFGGISRTAPQMIVISIAVAIVTTFAMLGLRKVGPRERPESIALHFSAIAAIALGALSLPVVTLPSARDLAYMIAGGTCAGFAQVAMTRAYTLERAARVASYGYSTVAFTSLLGAIFLHEVPDRIALCGMGLVLAAGLVVTLASLRDERAHVM